MAVYRIEYFKDAVLIGTTPWSGTLDEVKKVADGGLVRHNADMARIIDVGGSGAEVDSVTRGA